MGRWSVGIGMAVWVIASVFGAVVIALPDEGARLFSLSEGHGPSTIDAIGVAILLLGWLAFLTPLWRARAAIAYPGWLAALAVAAAALTVWSVVTDSGNWWMVGSAVLVAVQLAAGVSAAGARR